MKPRRSMVEITGEILSAAKQGVGKTVIVYRANLNFTRAEKYLCLLLSKGLVSTITGSLKYKTTERGLEFLRAYGDMRRTADFLSSALFSGD